MAKWQFCFQILMKDLLHTPFCSKIGFHSRFVHVCTNIGVNLITFQVSLMGFQKFFFVFGGWNHFGCRGDIIGTGSFICYLTI